MKKINVYICKKGHQTITRDTKDKTDLVTPMFITCPECKEQAVSGMYGVPQDLEPTHEWFEPKTIDELKAACVPLYGDVFSDEEYKDMLGFLMYRRI